MSSESPSAVPASEVETHENGNGPDSLLTWLDFDRDSVVFLLGAGASDEGGLPLSREITRLALADLGQAETPDFGNQVVLALRYVCGALIKYDTDRGGSPTDLPDIELVVSAVELLSQRDSLEVSPFVDAWDPMVDMKGVSPFPPGFDEDFSARILAGGSVERLLREAMQAEGGRGNTMIWEDLHTHLVQDLRKRLLLPEIEKFWYLDPLITLGKREKGITIATLNYDLSIEGRAALLGIPCDTGIQSWIDNGEVIWQPGGLHLLKLHGSIGWSFFDQASKPGQLAEGVFYAGDANVQGSRPAVVFGQREKLRANGPFLEIFAEFRRRLARSTVLVVVGYSFRDQHVNETIRHWINEGTTRRLIVVDPHFPSRWSGSPPGISDFRQELNRAFLSVRLPAQEPLVPFRFTVIRKTAREAFGDLHEDQVQPPGSVPG